MNVIMTIYRDSQVSLLEEQRGLGKPLYDFPKLYSAATINAETMVPMKTTAAFTVQDRLIFWLAETRDAVVVDGRVFTDLATVDGTSLGAGDKRIIGTLLQPQELAPRRLAELMITADVVLTWAHIGSELSLVEEVATEDGWSGRYKGTHTYFTNEENVDPLAFWIRVSATGDISVEGG